MTTIKTEANDVGADGMGVLFGVGVAAIAGLYTVSKAVHGTDRIIATTSLILASVITAIVMWLMLTDFEKMCKLFAANQLVSFVFASIIGVALVSSGAVVYRAPALA